MKLKWNANCNRFIESSKVFKITVISGVSFGCCFHFPLENRIPIQRTRASTRCFFMVHCMAILIRKFLSLEFYLSRRITQPKTLYTLNLFMLFTGLMKTSATNLANTQSPHRWIMNIELMYRIPFTIFLSFSQFFFSQFDRIYSLCCRRTDKPQINHFQLNIPPFHSHKLCIFFYFVFSFLHILRLC